MEVEVGNAAIVEHFRVVAESDAVINAVSARRVLTWLLQVEDGTNVLSANESVTKWTKGNVTYSWNCEMILYFSMRRVQGRCDAIITLEIKFEWRPWKKGFLFCFQFSAGHSYPKQNWHTTLPLCLKTLAFNGEDAGLLLFSPFYSLFCWFDVSSVLGRVLVN